MRSASSVLESLLSSPNKLKIRQGRKQSLLEGVLVPAHLRKENAIVTRKTQEQVIFEQEKYVYRSYKDRVFRMLFSDRKRLLELYNALNGTDYANVEDLTVNTLENAIYINMKNDVSFIIDHNMCLYEHQSSYSPNMPLRGLLYFADLYKKLLRGTDLSTRSLIKIPTPYYVVFYNGLERQDEEFVQKLSDAFENGKDGCIELRVRAINVNFGHNRELLEKCKTLYGYAYFVAEVRKNLETMELHLAVELAVEECIRKDILKEFLQAQRDEVIAMSIYEYNEEYVRQSFFEDGEKSGYDKGEKAGYGKGKADGEKAGYGKGKADGEKTGYGKGKADGDNDRLVKSVESAMENFKLDLQKACEGLGTTVEEYRKAKENRNEEK